MNCPDCKAPSRPGATRCKQCGRALPPSCFGCGAPVPADVELCHNCRTERVPQALGSDTEETERAPELMPSSEYDLNVKFIGRKPALERLRRILTGCRDSREMAFVTLTGEPGSGKTRLAREFGRLARGAMQQARVLHTVCGGPGAAPYAAFQRLFTARFGISEGDSARAARDRIKAGCTEAVGERAALECAHLIGELTGYRFESSPVVGPLADTPAQLEVRMFIAVRRFLVADARKGPLLLVFDEAERATPETVNLIHYLAAGLAAQP